MKRDLQVSFRVPPEKISVIPFGINQTVPNTTLTGVEAKQRLGLSACHKAVLFFGNIAPYKGLDCLIEAMSLLAGTSSEYRLIIVGRPKGGRSYWETILRRISSAGLHPMVIQRIEYVADADTELYFKAADVLVLPYTHVFQSGVLFLSYNFGLPVVASDVGSLREDIVEGKTGFVCKPRDPAGLATALQHYFASDLYADLTRRRDEIKGFATEKYSWVKVGTITKGIYGSLLA
jgi:glycosyltransferase involved in cell wall biosynthesis